MATISNVEDLLRWAVRERLEEISVDHPEMVITFHLALDHRLSYERIPSEDDPSVQVGELTQSPVWMLNLTFSADDRHLLSLNGVVPYPCCASGRTEPLVEMVDALWERFVLAYTLSASGLAEDMQKILGDHDAGDTD